MPTIEINWMDLKRLCDWEPLAYFMIVLRNARHTCVINTGPPRYSDELNEYWQAIHPNHELFVHDDERPLAALAKLGLAPQDVNHVFLTPLAAYATGNLDLFTEASIHMGRTGWIDYLAPQPYVHRMPDSIYLPPRIRSYLLEQASDRISLLGDEEQEPLPGIKSFFAGGHHRSSMAYAIQTEQGIFTVSDCFFKYRNVEQGIPLGINESMTETLRSYDRIRKIGGKLLPLYDPEVLERHPGGHVC